MRLVELQPQFYRYEIRYEDISKVDPAFTWDQSRGQYFDAVGRSWHGEASIL